MFNSFAKNFEIKKGDSNRTAHNVRFHSADIRHLVGSDCVETHNGPFDIYMISATYKYMYFMAYKLQQVKEQKTAKILLLADIKLISDLLGNVLEKLNKCFGDKKFSDYIMVDGKSMSFIIKSLIIAMNLCNTVSNKNTFDDILEAFKNAELIVNKVLEIDIKKVNELIDELSEESSPESRISFDDIRILRCCITDGWIDVDINTLLSKGNVKLPKYVYDTFDNLYTEMGKTLNFEKLSEYLLAIMMQNDKTTRNIAHIHDLIKNNYKIGQSSYISTDGSVAITRSTDFLVRTKTVTLPAISPLLFLITRAGAIMMDFYLLGRLFKKFTTSEDDIFSRETADDIIIAAGYAHIKSYMSFFENIGFDCEFNTDTMDVRCTKNPVEVLSKYYKMVP